MVSVFAPRITSPAPLIEAIVVPPFVRPAKLTCVPAVVVTVARPPLDVSLKPRLAPPPSAICA